MLVGTGVIVAVNGLVNMFVLLIPAKSRPLVGLLVSLVVVNVYVGLLSGLVCVAIIVGTKTLFPLAREACLLPASKRSPTFS